MATNTKQTTNYKLIFWCMFVVFLFLLGRLGYLKLSNMYVEYNTKHVQTKISQKEAELRSFSDKPGYDKLNYVRTLESNNHAIPWSDHINAIMDIFHDLLEVDKSDAFNISFSDFEISLERIKLNGYVTNLSILYQGADSKQGLISRFEELSFLDNISIKVYEKTNNTPGFKKYKFTLTANVINNGK